MYMAKAAALPADGIDLPTAGPAFADRFWSSPDGLTLHARDYPAASGPAQLPVICIHGLTRNSRDFEDLAPHIAARGRRVLAVDVRGRGQSAWDPLPVNYQPTTYAGDVVSMMSALGLARSHFIGTSMGGLITMALASVRPELVAGAVLNDVGPELGPAGLARIGGYVGRNAGIGSWREAAAYVQEQNAALLPHYRKADWERMARRLFRSDGRGRPVLDYDPAIAAALATLGRTPSNWPLWTRLTRNRPVLVIRGGNSDLLAPETFGRMRDAAPQADFVEVPDVGHAPMLDEPEALGALDAFLAAHP